MMVMYRRVGSFALDGSNTHEAQAFGGGQTARREEETT